MPAPKAETAAALEAASDGAGVVADQKLIMGFFYQRLYNLTWRYVRYVFYQGLVQELLLIRN